MKASLSWLADPEVFQVNRQKAHSDHKFMVNGKETKISLNGTWKFHYAENPSGRPADFYQMDYDDSAFETIEVPGHIQTQGYDRMQYINTMYPWDGREFLRPPYISETYNPTASYVREFTLQKKEEEKIFLSFQGVETAFYVWLNGEFLGYSEDTFTPSEFDITDLAVDGVNRLAVEVYKRSSASWIEDQDFWRFSGIFRDVYVYTVPKTHVRDLFVKSGLVNDYQDGELRLELELTGELTGSVQAVLRDAEGFSVWEQEQSIGTESVLFEGEIKGVCAWSAEIPNLYTLTMAVLAEDGSAVETIEQKVGFRTFEMKNGVMHINGKRIIFKGVNRHEFNARRGRSITVDDMMWDIRFMKQHNINAVRTCHYPDQSLWYQLCDEYGIYLIDEMNLESHGSWQKMGAVEPSWNVPGSLPQWKECVLDRAKSMVQRDKNHPSIVIWSCGNESYAGDVLQAVSDYFHETDSSRLVHYEGVFHNRKYDAISDMESRMYAKPAEVEEYLKQNTGKPYISCEYMHAMGNSLGGMELYTRLEDLYEGYQGGFIWDYIDQAVYKTLDDGTETLVYGGDFDERATDYCFCTNGIIFADRTVSPKAQEAKALYANVRIRVENQVAEIENRNLFADTSYLNFIFRVEKEGAVLAKESRSICVQPGETVSVPFGLSVPSESGEYCLNVSAVLAQNTIWADAGFEVSFGQEAVTVEGEAEASKAGKLEVVHGDVNIGVYTDDFFAMFSKVEGGIISLVSDGREYITRAPLVSYWRASTDNDKGTQGKYNMGQWFAASMGQRYTPEGFSMEEAENQVTMHFAYEASTNPGFTTVVTYTVNADKTIDVSVSYPGVEGLPKLPVLAFDFKLKKEMNQVRYYGYGPEETYIDRQEGAKLGVFTTTPAKNLTPYLIPQECGNRTAVRWVEVTAEDGKGLRFEKVENNLECSVLPYSAYELENAMHIYELPRVNYTWVRMAAKQMGVGGDDSWGAPVHDEFMIDSDKPMELKFKLKVIH